MEAFVKTVSELCFKTGVFVGFLLGIGIMFFAIAIKCLTQ